MTDRVEGALPNCLGGFNGLTPRNLAILAGIAAFASLLVIAGCVIKFDGHTSHVGITVVLVYMFLAFPLILLGRSDTGSGSVLDNPRQTAIGHIAYFMTGVFGVSGPWLAFVLMRTDKITWQAMVFIITGGLVMVGAGALFNLLQKREEEDRSILL